MVEVPAGPDGDRLGDDQMGIGSLDLPGALS
jgi:hypothetical protein